MPRSSEIKSFSDEELVERFRHSYDNTYIGELFTRYQSLVYGLSLKYLKDHTQAEDAVMIIFEDLITALKKHPVAHFRGWMYTFSKNHCLQILRKSGRTSEKEKVYKKDVSVMENGTDEHLHKEEHEALLKALEKNISQLSEGQQTCLELFYLKNKSYDEIQELTGYTYNNVKSHIQNGKRNLKKLVENEKHV